MIKIIWRICEATFAESAFSGEGASIVGGRWNSKGKRMVYTAENLSLAILEVFVHLNVPTVEQDFFVAIKVEIPDNLDVEYMSADRLPSDWYLSSSKSLLQALGDEWIDSVRTPILAVPSAIVPQEFNCLINPFHPQFDRLIIDRPQPFNFDASMWK
ncbi:RES family NAD+ phosphorylase [Chamaesiphon sp. OTE_8_metabat_110]|uniref:RES family NAD+ phosphorylase n=1 Tax=Chamaesiphon sp. OTE_8_metabat_110 TaxID=2964696 RepID=UPI00286CB232|nr:RES family NAD+ phosphorylase [Chamaesiphon sp. OTE_8_metabat_110]